MEQKHKKPKHMHLKFILKHFLTNFLHTALTSALAIKYYFEQLVFKLLSLLFE